MANESLIIEVIHEFSYLANRNIQNLILSKVNDKGIITNPFHDLFYTVTKFEKEKFFEISEEKLIQILKKIKELNDEVKNFLNKKSIKQADLILIQTSFIEANRIIGNSFFRKTDISGNDNFEYDLNKNDLSKVLEKTLRQQEEMNEMIYSIEKKYEAERKGFQTQIDKYKSERDILIKQLNETIVNSKAEVNEIGEIKTKLQNEWDEFRENYKQIFAKAEIMRQSQNFKDDASEYYKMSRKWIVWIVISILLVFLTSVFFLAGCFDDVKCILDYQNSIKSSSLFGVLFYQKIISKILLRLFVLAIMV